MKNTLLLALFVLVFSKVQGQPDEKPLSGFNQIIISPRISVILTRGEKESIRLVCSNVSPSMVNVKVKGNTLHLYLDHSRIVEKRQFRGHDHYYGKEDIYADASVTAFVTYTSLRTIEIRGNGEVSCDTEITAEKFKLRAYGENEIRLASLKTSKLKASLYGENKVKIASGVANRQVYRLFGENRIDNQGLSSATASARMYGEGRLSLNATEEIHYSAFGEPSISISGNPVINRGIVIGHAAVFRD